MKDRHDKSHGDRPTGLIGVTGKLRAWYLDILWHREELKQRIGRECKEGENGIPSQYFVANFGAVGACSHYSEMSVFKEEFTGNGVHYNWPRRRSKSGSGQEVIFMTNAMDLSANQKYAERTSTMFCEGIGSRLERESRVRICTLDF